MASKDAVRAGKPFGDPSADEIFEILIPEGAESGKIPAAQYLMQLLSITFGKAKSSGNDMYTFVFTIAEGPYAGMDFELYCPLTDNAMWKLADTLTALGEKVTPGKLMKVRPAELKGTLAIGVIIDSKTNMGRDVSKLQGVMPHPDGAGVKAEKGSRFVVPSKADEDDEEQDEQPRGKKGKGLDWHTGEEPKARRNGRERDEEDEEEETPRRGRARARDEDEEEDEDERPRARGGKRSRL